MFIVTAKEMYEIDKYTTEEIGLPGMVLMENAGREMVRRITSHIQETDRITVFCGAGNNGGDGFVIARYLLEQGYAVRVAQAAPDDKIRGDAHAHQQVFINSGGKCLTGEDSCKEAAAASDIIIDALLGIGLTGPLRPPYAKLIRIINQAPARVFSVDIPSGLSADEGAADDTAVQAERTFVVGAVKLSAFLEGTAQKYGKWEVVDIGFSHRTIKRYSRRTLYDWKAFKTSLPERASNSHKGDHGRGLIIGGSHSMPGALVMATEAAVKTGAGLTTAGTLASHIPALASRVPEAMFRALPEDEGELTAGTEISFKGYDGIAVGVGMGRSKAGETLVRQVLEEAACPVLVDADGLYHLSRLLPALKARKAPAVLTPHAGEMARLAGISADELLKEPFRHTMAFAAEFNAYVVLKGKHTIITSPSGEQIVDSTGNPGLAKGGSGDVLTGIMLAMMIQKQPLLSAVCNACFLHGKSADLAVCRKHSVYDLAATNLIEWIPEVYRTIS
jgi:NAD(P)H-hydrate epimerase